MRYITPALLSLINEWTLGDYLVKDWLGKRGEAPQNLEIQVANHFLASANLVSPSAGANSASSSLSNDNSTGRKRHGDGMNTKRDGIEMEATEASSPRYLLSLPLTLRMKLSSNNTKYPDSTPHVAIVTSTTVCGIAVVRST